MKKTDAVVAGKKTSLVKMKKGELLQLNNVLTGLKIGKLQKESAFSIVDTKISLSEHVRTIEAAQRTASEELKPAGLKEGVQNESLEKEWNSKYMDYMNKYLEEEIEVKISPLCRDELYELSKDNNLEVWKIEMLNILV